MSTTNFQAVIGEVSYLRNCLASFEQNTFYFYENGKRSALSFPELLEIVDKTASYLQAKGVVKSTRIGILSPNSFEWVVLDLACVVLGAVTVPFHDVQSIEDRGTVFSHFDLSLFFVNTENLELFTSHSSQVVELNKLKELVAEFPPVDEETLVTVFPDDIFSMVFTSGTTGMPKAIEMPKKSVDDFLKNVNEMFQFRRDDKAIIFLPLSHFGQRSYIYGSILFGFDFVLVSTDNLFVSFKKDQPTILVAVPYFFENLYKLGGEEINTTSESIIKSVLGGKMRIMLTGSAPISERVLEGFQKMNMDIYEAYGTNETGLIALNYPNNSKIGSVGKLFPNKEIQFTDNGVIQIRSDVAWGREYFKDEKAGEGVFLEDGFINTGDIGYMDEDGFIFLKGRESQLIILSNGKKVHPQSVETKLLENQIIKQVCLFGSRRPHLTAVIVVEEGQDPQSVIEAFNTTVPEFMQVKGSVVTAAPFSIENGLLTSSLKLNRRVIYEQYSDEIEKFY